MSFLPPIDEIHPLFVHFPIALYTTAFLWDTLGFIRKDEALSSAGWWNMILAQVSAVATGITGFLADSLVGHMEKPFPIWSTHGSVQIFTFLWMIGIFGYRWKKLRKFPVTGSIPWGYLLSFGIGILLLFYGSHLGAKLANRI